MYAIVVTGGKQLKVEPGKRYFIEKIEQAVGETVTFEQVLLLKQDDQLTVGQPTVQAKVVARVVDQFRDKKIEIIKHKRRKHHMKRQGHRQYLTCIEVLEIAS